MSHWEALKQRDAMRAAQAGAEDRDATERLDEIRHWQSLPVTRDIAQELGSARQLALETTLAFAQASTDPVVREQATMYFTIDKLYRTLTEAHPDESDSS